MLSAQKYLAGTWYAGQRMADTRAWVGEGKLPEEKYWCVEVGDLSPSTWPGHQTGSGAGDEHLGCIQNFQPKSLVFWGMVKRYQDQKREHPFGPGALVKRWISLRYQRGIAHTAVSTIQYLAFSWPCELGHGCPNWVSASDRIGMDL